MVKAQKIKVSEFQGFWATPTQWTKSGSALTFRGYGLGYQIGPKWDQPLDICLIRSDQPQIVISVANNMMKFE